MSESDGGFSFGSRNQSPDESEEVDAIEVSGEPVSRSEAKNLGLAAIDASRERSATSIVRMGELPPDLDPGLAQKLDAAWNHLKKNEIEQAMTLAQDVVFEQPTLVAAKLIIARCFINRKEYDKALALLQAIPEEEKNAESWYYIGLCQSRIGKIKEAIDSLKFCRSAATDTLLRKRANDMLLHLQGEQIECPICGRKSLYDSMVEVGNQTICANCAKNAVAGDDEEDDDEDFDGAGGTRKRKRLRPPLTRSDVLIRIGFAFFLFVMMCFGMYVLYLLAPGYYSAIRSYLPAHWEFPPVIEDSSGDVDGSGGQAQQQVRIIPGLITTSAPIDRVIAGIEVHRQLHYDGMENNRVVAYDMVFYPSPVGKPSFDKTTGLFSWSPASGDVGKTYEVSFTAKYPNILSGPQINSFTVSGGPEFAEIARWEGAALTNTYELAAADMDGDADQELLLVSGEYWNGEVALFKAKNGQYEKKAVARLRGRPVGAGVVNAGTEKWLAVPDYWSSRVRYYGFRNGSIAEMAATIELPGRPIVAGFDSEDSVIAVLCKLPGSMKVVAFRQDARSSRQLGEWTVPDTLVWSKLLVLRRNTSNPDAPISLALLGSQFSDSALLLTQGQEAPRVIKHGIDGSLVDARLGSGGSALYCLVEEDGKLQIARLNPSADLSGDGKPVLSDAGEAPALSGFAVVDFSGKGYADVVVLKAATSGMAVGDKGGSLSNMAYWPLQTPPRLYGSTASMAIPGGNGAQGVVYVDQSGGIWMMKISTEVKDVKPGAK